MGARILSLVLVISLLMSLCVFAEGEYSLEEAIFTAKTKLEIPENYTNFYSQIEQNNNGKVFYLSWSGEGDENEKGGYASAKVDELGRIIYYSHYEYGSFEGDYKLSQLDYNGAVDIAEEYIKQICKEFAPSMQAVRLKNYIERNSNLYYVRFNRYENGIPYYNNYIVAAISARSSKLAELEVRWDDIDKFPSGQGVLPMERAKDAFKEKIGVSLNYYNDNSDKVILQYIPNMTGKGYINAFTGDISETNITGGNFATSGIEKYNFQYTDRSHASEGTEGLQSIEQLEQSARNQLEIDDIYALGPTNLMSDNNANFYYNMIFASSDKTTINIEINAKTKEIVEYNKIGNYTEENRVNQENAFKSAKSFAEKVVPKKLEACRLNQSSIFDYNYLFNFPRVVNGLEYMGNGITISVSASTGEVVSYSLSWNQKIFQSATNVATKDEVYSELFDRVGMELQYVATANRGVIYPKGAKDINIKLVYNFVPGKSLFVNATNGKLANENGIAYTSDLESKYVDIQGHQSQKNIETLVACKIFNESENFYPDKNIIQSDYLTWIYRAIKQNDAYGDKLYNDMIYGYNVITESERNDDSELTLEDAVKYLIRMLGYTDVAELKDTYETGFVDEGVINPNLIGYAAIAKGLNIIKGNAFTPKRVVTRATAAEIIYNLLTN